MMFEWKCKSVYLRTLLAFLVSVFVFFPVHLLYADQYVAPSEVHLELDLAFSDDGPLNKEFRVKIEVGTYQQNDEFNARAQDIKPLVPFTQGKASFNLDFVKDFGLSADRLRTLSSPYFKVSVSDVGSEFSEDAFVLLPFPSTPFALQARYAEQVLHLEADKIRGSFTQPFVVQNWFKVTNNGRTQILVSDNFVGIHVEEVNDVYDMEVSGNINLSRI
jgi:hypothetical protein